MFEDKLMKQGGKGGVGNERRELEQGQSVENWSRVGAGRVDFDH